jgi:hypothetical protein
VLSGEPEGKLLSYLPFPSLPFRPGTLLTIGLNSESGKSTFALAMLRLVRPLSFHSLSPQEEPRLTCGPFFACRSLSKVISSSMARTRPI